MHGNVTAEINAPLVYIYVLLATNNLETELKPKCSSDYVASVWTKYSYKLLFVGNVSEYAAVRQKGVASVKTTL